MSFWGHCVVFPKLFACCDLLHRRITIHDTLRHFLICDFPHCRVYVLYSYKSSVSSTVFKYKSNMSRLVSLSLNSQVGIWKSQWSFSFFSLNKLNGIQNPWWFIKWLHCSWKSYSSWPTAAACPSSQYLSLQSVGRIPLYSQLCFWFTVGWSQNARAVCSIHPVKGIK